MIFPASHYVTNRDAMERGIVEIEHDLDERVKEFAARHTKKLTCFDTKEYALPGISDEFRPLLSPVVMAAVLQRISKNIEVITDHSLDIRRYYRKESY